MLKINVSKYQPIQKMWVPKIENPYGMPLLYIIEYC